MATEKPSSPAKIRILPQRNHTGPSESKENSYIRDRICYVVKKSGELILSYTGDVRDTGTSRGHELSTIDDFARNIVGNALAEVFPDKHYIGSFELRQVGVRPYGEKPATRADFYAVVDEIDGTTNTKRELANLKPGDIPRPQAGTSIAVCRKNDLGSVLASAVYTFDRRDTYSAFKADGSFFSYKDDLMLRESDYGDIKGDSKARLLLAAYSNLNTEEEARWKFVLKQKVGPTYEGCRASSIDIINIIRGLSDAYVDGRAVWGESGAKLQAYDVAAVIPIAVGLGFSVSDVYGEPWQKYKINDTISLVIARSAKLHGEILNAIAPLLPEKKGGELNGKT